MRAAHLLEQRVAVVGHELRHLAAGDGLVAEGLECLLQRLVEQAGAVEAPLHVLQRNGHNSCLQKSNNDMLTLRYWKTTADTWPVLIAHLCDAEYGLALHHVCSA